MVQAAVEPLALQTAQRLAHAAAVSLELVLRPEASSATSASPCYSWVGVAVGERGLLAMRGAGLQQAAREALRVLTALASCPGFALMENPSFWRALWPEDPQWRQRQPMWARKWRPLQLQELPMASREMPRFLLRLNKVETSGKKRRLEALALLEDLFLVDDPRGGSAEFVEAMATLERHIPPWRRPAHVECGIEVDQCDVKRLHRLAVAVETRASKKAKCSGQPNGSVADLKTMPLVLTGCFLSLPDSLENPRVLTDLATCLQSRGPRIPVRELKLAFGSKNASLKGVDKVLQHFQPFAGSLASAHCGDSSGGTSSDQTRDAIGFKRDQATLRTLHLSGKSLTDEAFLSAVFLALPTISSLRELRVKMPRDASSDAHERLWRWLALSLFHSDSHSSVRSLELDLGLGDVSPKTVGAIREMVELNWSTAMAKTLAHDPCLLGKPPIEQELGRSVGSRVVADIKSGTRIEAEPVRRWFSWPLVQLSHDQELNVICVLEDWVCVQLPGYGRGFVQRNCVTAIRSLSNPVEARGYGITSLTLSTKDVDATMAILQTVGGRLEKLNLSCMSFGEAHLAELLKCCPRLVQLTLRSGKLRDFSALVDASAAGTCLVASLNLFTFRVEESCLQHLVTTLSNPKLARASALRSLRLNSGLLTKSDLEALLGLLDANRTLRSLQLRIDFSLFDEFMPRFLAHRGDRVRGGYQESKTLAFLSVLGPSGCPNSPMQRVDAVVLGHILDFVGEGERLITLDEYTDRMSLREIEARSAQLVGSRAIEIPQLNDLVLGVA